MRADKVGEANPFTMAINSITQGLEDSGLDQAREKVHSFARGIFESKKSVFNEADKEKIRLENMMGETSARLQKAAKADLYKTVEYAISLAKSPNVREKERSLIQKFFLNLSKVPLSHFAWDKELADEEALQRVLSPELDKLLKEEAADSELVNSEEHQLEVALAKAELCARLGYGISSAGGGVNGAQIIRSFEGEPLIVFKPSQQLKWYQFGERLKQCFGQARLLNQAQGVRELAEVAAHKLDKTFGFRITPAAKACQIQGKDGVCLFFLKGYRQLRDVIPDLEKRSQFSHSEKILFQKGAVYDFLTGNMDGHDENGFVIIENGEIKELRMIDHGNAFIESNPGDWGLQGNQYLWGRLKIAQEEFCPEVIDFIKNMKGEHLHSFVESFHSSFFNDRMVERLEERFTILKERVALTKDIRSPAQLATFRKNSTISGLQNSPKIGMREDGDFVIVDIFA